MDFDQALEALDELLSELEQRRLAQAERFVLEAAWERREYAEQAKMSPYSTTYLQRTVAPPLWQLLSKLVGKGRKITKYNVRYLLERQFDERLTVPVPVVAREQNSHSTSIASSTSTQPICRIATPPKITNFFGRSPELAMLREATKENRCVVITGAGGIGKSALAAKLVQEPNLIQAHILIWKSIPYAPRLQDLLLELIRACLPSVPTDLPEDNYARTTILIEQLSTQRCLIVLDAADAVLQNLDSQVAPVKDQYKDHYKDYQVFLKRIVEETHQSCLLLTSRRAFSDLCQFRRRGQSVRFVKLEGLGREALEICRATGLIDEQHWGTLVETHRGNPSELQIVAKQIVTFFGGRVGEYLSYKTTYVSDSLIEWLDQEFAPEGDLTNLDRKLMIYLAQELAKQPGPIAFLPLLDGFRVWGGNGLSVSALMKMLSDLEDRFLVELTKRSSGEIAVNLEPAIHKYILKDLSGLVQTSLEGFENELEVA